LNYKLADDASLNIKKYGKYLFEHIVIFAPSVEELGGSLSVEALTEFVDEGGKYSFKNFENTLINYYLFRKFAGCWKLSVE
jgi:Oligosaccharyltransferase 48 kDa subunit beta